jgi:glutamate-1-semialdehyde aminotransferase
VYFAPSQFEAGFLSVAHGPAELEQAEKAAAEVLAAL